MSDHDRSHPTTITRRKLRMLALPSRSTLLAGMLILGLSEGAWSADTEAVRPNTTGVGPPTARAAPADPGPTDAPPTASAQATVRVAQSQPTRAHGTLPGGKRYAGTRARVGYFRPMHRYSLILGIGY
jgi:hypothetical protein